MATGCHAQLLTFRPCSFASPPFGGFAGSTYERVHFSNRFITHNYKECKRNCYRKRDYFFGTEYIDVTMKFDTAYRFCYETNAARDSARSRGGGHRRKKPEKPAFAGSHCAFAFFPKRHRCQRRNNCNVTDRESIGPKRHSRRGGNKKSRRTPLRAALPLRDGANGSPKNCVEYE